MIKVWVLIAYMWAGYAGGPVIIDNIASKSECERLVQSIKYLSSSDSRLYSNPPSTCIEVWKVK